MRVQILGTGCPRCQELHQNTLRALEELNLAADVQKVTDLREIASFGVMATPALVVDGAVKSAGKSLSPADIKRILQP